MRHTSVALLISLFALGLQASSATPAQWTHELALTPANVHWGYYDGKLEPVLTIASGDTVRVEAMLARGLERLYIAGAREDEIPEALKAVEEAITERGPGSHPLTGPIYVEGAEIGDVLEVRIIDFEYLHPFGVAGFIAEGGTIPDYFPYARFKLIRFDIEAGTTTAFAPGVTLKLAPFWGSIGVAPSPVAGRISSNPPGSHAGNLDNKELVAGSVLYLPVHVPGALVSIGDGHAMQGDGEVSLAALETSLRGTVQIILHKDRSLLWPRAETPTHYITMGFHPDLDEAARMAVRNMVNFLVEEKGLHRDDAYILCSLAMDLSVTQLVDGTKGIHAKVEKSIFQ